MLKKMLKSKKFKVCAILLICYIFGASIIYAIFYRMQHNPTDQAAMPYIWEDKSFENQYGKVEHVGRNFKYKTKETDNEKKSLMVLKRINIMR